MRSVSGAARRLYELLVELERHRSLRHPLMSAVEELQLTPPQFHAILSLGNERVLTMGDLARRLGVTEKTVTGVVDRLERLGHLHRDRDEGDRRVVRVRLTRRGAFMFQRLNRQVREKLRRGLDLLHPAERETLIHILETLLQRLAASTAGAEPRRKAAP